ncbi:MAG: MBL fold metallo-hydrolase [Planctomycetota bacterium]
MNRREFLGTMAAAVGGPKKKPIAKSPSGLTLTLKGRKNSSIKRWDVITIGNLSRNRYWGESDDRGVRSAICSCTVITGDGFRIIVDPSLRDEKAMATELDRRTGLSLDEIDAVFITHQHGDHHFGLKHFPKTKWLAGAEVAAGLNKSGRYGKSIAPAGDSLFDAVEVLLVIAGDAVATEDFWIERMGYFNAVDFDLSARTMDKIASIADIVVPGHDNYFLCI